MKVGWSLIISLLLLATSYDKDAVTAEILLIHL